MIILIDKELRDKRILLQQKYPKNCSKILLT